MLSGALLVSVAALFLFPFVSHLPGPRSSLCSTQTQTWNSAPMSPLHHRFPCLSNRPRWHSGPCRGLTPQPQNNCCSVLGSLGHSSVPGGCPGASKALLAGFPSPGCSAPPSALTTLPLSSYRAVLLFVAFLTPGLSFPFLKIIHVLLQPEGPQKDRKGHRKSSLLFPSSPFKSL